MAEDYASTPLEESDAPSYVPPSRNSNKNGKAHLARGKADRNRQSSLDRSSPKPRNASRRHGNYYGDDGPETSSSNDEVSSEDRRPSQRTREGSAAFSKSVNDKRVKNQGKRQDSASGQKDKNSSRKSHDARNKGHRKQFDQYSTETEVPQPGPRRDSPSYTSFLLQFGPRDSSVEGEPTLSSSSYGLPGLRTEPNRDATGRRMFSRLSDNSPSSIKCCRCGAGPEAVGEIFQKLPACRYCLEELALAREAPASSTRPLVPFNAIDSHGASPLHFQSASNISELGPAAAPNEALRIALFNGPSYESNVMGAHSSFESGWEEAPHIQRHSYYSPPSESAALLVNTHVPYDRRGEGAPSSSAAQRQGGPFWNLTADKRPPKSNGVVQRALSGDALLEYMPSALEMTSQAPSFGGGQLAGEPEMIAYEAWQRYARDYRRFQQNLAEWELQQHQWQKLLHGRRPPGARDPPPPNAALWEDGTETGDEEPMRLRVAVAPKSRRSRAQLVEATGLQARRPPAASVAQPEQRDSLPER